MEKMFRLLRADEIECRVNQVTEKGCGLLLYKDARCDQNILDETVGPMNWQRRHSRENANCEVGVWDAEKEQWIWKEDTGTESNTEAAKGLASDSFKRACFNWGIGRELYTAPFVWLQASDVNLIDGRNGKKTTYDKFSVDEIGYDEAGRINKLTISNTKTGKTVYSFGKAKKADKKKDTPQTVEQADEENREAIRKKPVGETKARALESLLGDNGILVDTIYKLYKVKKLSDLTEVQHSNIFENLDKIKERQDGEQGQAN